MQAACFQPHNNAILHSRKVRFYFVFRSIYTTFANVEYMFAYGCLFQNLQHISNIDRQMYVNNYQTISKRWSDHARYRIKINTSMLIKLLSLAMCHPNLGASDKPRFWHAVVAAMSNFLAFVHMTWRGGNNPIPGEKIMLNSQ